MADRSEQFIDIRAGYLSHAHDTTDEIVAQAVRHLTRVKFDTLVGIGLSGALVVPVIARALDKHWLIIRKPSEGSHSGRRAEGTLGKRWVFCDDLIDSGSTRDTVMRGIKAISENYEFTTKYVGDYLYHDYYPGQQGFTRGGVLKEGAEFTGRTRRTR